MPLRFATGRFRRDDLHRGNDRRPYGNGPRRRGTASSGGWSKRRSDHGDHGVAVLTPAWDDGGPRRLLPRSIATPVPSAHRPKTIYRSGPQCRDRPPPAMPINLQMRNEPTHRSRSTSRTRGIALRDRRRSAFGSFLEPSSFPVPRIRLAPLSWPRVGLVGADLAGRPVPLTHWMNVTKPIQRPPPSLPGLGHADMARSCRRSVSLTYQEIWRRRYSGQGTFVLNYTREN
jgi:hypothetical protein